jgi:hypothetical protein
MPSESFIIAKRKGRWFEWLLRSVLPDLGFEVIDTDGWSYSSKKGVDIVVRIKKGDRIYQENLEAKFDELSEKTGNVCIDLDSLEKSKSPIWIYGLPEESRIDCYAMYLSDLAPYVLGWPIKRAGGEFRGKLALVPKTTFLGQSWIHKLRSIEITQENSYQAWLSTQRVAA